MSPKLSAILVASLLCQTAFADESDPCTRFTWDVSQELAVMKQSPHATEAAIKPGNDAPQLQIGKLYDLKLAPQSGVTFAITPGKPTLADGAQAGLVRFRTDKAGRYRVAMTSGHWIDLVDGKTLIKSRDFQGARGCERPRKIVEFDLPAGRELTLQLSGASDAVVAITVTAVPGAVLGTETSGTQNLSDLPRAHVRS